jgi:hypothetical protein
MGLTIRLPGLHVRLRQSVEQRAGLSDNSELGKGANDCLMARHLLLSDIGCCQETAVFTGSYSFSDIIAAREQK